LLHHSDTIKKDLDDLTAGFAKYYLYVLDQNQTLLEHPDNIAAREQGLAHLEDIAKGLAQKMDKIRRELYG
jgi:hypothetical protein